MGESRPDCGLIIRGRRLVNADIEEVRQLVTKSGNQGRNYVSKQLAHQWQWRQANGRLKDTSCLFILRELERKRLISFPVPVILKKRQGKEILPKLKSEINSSQIDGDISNVLPLRLERVNDKDSNRIWKYVNKKYHYLGYRILVGQNLKYLVYSGNRLIASLGWQSAVDHLSSRDFVIGWTKSQRREYLHKIVNNSRFLIMPWVRVKNVASYILSQSIKQLRIDWEQKYASKLWIAETFVDGERFKGTCYKAANWTKVGITKGYSKKGEKFEYHGNPKEVYLYILDKKALKKIKKDFTEPMLTRKYLLSSVKLMKKIERRKRMISVDRDWKPELNQGLEINENDIERMSEELKGFHSLFKDGFKRIEQIDLSLCYLQGLLSGLHRKTIELIALKFRNQKNVRNLQRFMGEYKWDEEYIGNKHKEEVSKALLETGGVLSVDSSEIVKKGKESVGVSRQYCGRLGKVENCQSGVYVGYASPKGHALIDKRLFMPKVWFSDEYEERRIKCKVPKDLVFKKKTELAAEMITEILEGGLFPSRWVTCDTIFGNSQEFLNNIPNDINYLADIPNDKTVWVKTEKETGSASTSAIKVSEIAKDGNTDWKYTKLAEGSKGSVFGYVARIKVFLKEKDVAQNERWLFIRKSSNAGELKYCISNASKETSLKEMIHVSTMRWPIERSFQEGKSELGMADYEHRSWQAWHRHMTYVFLAQLFLIRIGHMLKKNAYFNFATNS